ncbi:UPF0149 family protein [Atopomonas sediminilitoris]|uniref:UPF0149 family protein n=1 Tax=Atopomonas sediminilitoris TaxID=2919919 RepID=UPI001F4E5AD2|nr:UPF0149 family protein [Atopomonas sediminilitoris]MCJ8168274.1 UPF0149 family protein [Atopomonas sediminilitoris]
MSAAPYSALADLLGQVTPHVSPAELHGHLLGYLCAGVELDDATWLGAAAELLTQPQGVWPEALGMALKGLRAMSAKELGDGEMAVVVLLPGDDMPLVERSRALGQWCQGFLAGFGLAGASLSLSEDAQEVLTDLAAIAQIAGEANDSDEAEGDYMEVQEYLRVAPLLLFSEARRSLRQAQSDSAKNTLH